MVGGGREWGEGGRREERDDGQREGWTGQARVIIFVSSFSGLLQREHDPSVVYGSIDGGKNINADEKIAELVG